MRALVLLLILPLAGCLAAEDVTPSSLAPIEGLVVLENATTTRQELTGSVGFGPQGALPGSVEEKALDLPPGALFVRVNLTWTTKGNSPETSDLDFQIRDANGRVVAQGATLAEEESASVRITPRIELPLSVRVVNYLNPPTDYLLVVEVVGR